MYYVKCPLLSGWCMHHWDMHHSHSSQGSSSEWLEGINIGFNGQPITFLQGYHRHPGWCPRRSVFDKLGVELAHSLITCVALYDYWRTGLMFQLLSKIWLEKRRKRVPRCMCISLRRECLLSSQTPRPTECISLLAFQFKCKWSQIGLHKDAEAKSFDAAMNYIF